MLEGPEMFFIFCYRSVWFYMVLCGSVRTCEVLSSFCDVPVPVVLTLSARCLVQATSPRPPQLTDLSPRLLG